MPPYSISKRVTTSSRTFNNTRMQLNALFQVYGMAGFTMCRQRSPNPSAVKILDLFLIECLPLAEVVLHLHRACCETVVIMYTYMIHVVRENYVIGIIKLQRYPIDCIVQPQLLTLPCEKPNNCWFHISGNQGISWCCAHIVDLLLSNSKVDYIKSLYIHVLIIYMST